MVGYLGLTTLNRLDNVKPIATRDLTVHHKKLELLIATGILVKSLYSLGSLITPKETLWASGSSFLQGTSGNNSASF